MELANIVKRTLTPTETEILTTLAGSQRGVGRERLLQYTTDVGLGAHLSNIRGALAEGYAIRKRRKRYYLALPTDVDCSAEDDIDAIDAIDNVDAIVITEPDTDPVVQLRSQLLAKKSVLEASRDAMRAQHEQLANELAVAELRIGEIDRSLHVLDSCSELLKG